VGYANKADLYKNQIARWIRIKQKAIEYKGCKCVMCGYDKHYGALEFHHLDSGDKDVNWTKLRLRSWDKITAELDKCVLLCANCHREEHHKLRQDALSN